MDGLPDSLVIAIWIVGACWSAVLAAYVLNAGHDFIFAVVTLGIFTALVELAIRRADR